MAREAVLVDHTEVVVVVAGVAMQVITSLPSNNNKCPRPDIITVVAANMVVLRMCRVRSRGTEARRLGDTVVMRAMTGHGLMTPGPEDRRVAVAEAEGSMERDRIRREEGEWMDGWRTCDGS